MALPSLSSYLAHPEFAWAAIASFAACVAILLTRAWHGEHTLDHAEGVQKVHENPTPRVGGLALALGLLIGWLVDVDHHTESIMGPMLIAALPCFVFGIAEDLTKRVGVRARLLATLASGVLAWALTGTMITRLDVAGLDLLLQWTPFAVAFTAFAVGGMANAVNIIDGFNGVAAGVLVICLAAFAVVAWQVGDTALVQVCLLLCAAILGFMAVNYPRGAIFLGDGGAYGLGFMLAWVAILLPARNPGVSPWTSLLVCAYPIIEVVVSIVRRLARDASPGAPDSRHLHSLLFGLLGGAGLVRQARWRNPAVAPFIWLFASGPAVMAMLGFQHTLALAVAFGVTLALYVASYRVLVRIVPPAWASTPGRGALKIVLFANTDWYLYNFRRSLALALRKNGYEVLLVSPPGPYGARLQALGLRWVPAPMHRRSLNPLREAALVLWLRRLLLREQVDLVHGFTIKCAVYGSIAARLAGVPARVSALTGMGHVFTSDAPTARLLRPVVRGLLRLALGGPRARLVVQNSDDLALVTRMGAIHPHRIRLIPGSGVDCARFTPAGAPPAGTSAERPLRVLLASRLLWDKGVGEFVDAAVRLQVPGRAIEFLLAGEPDAGNPVSVPPGTVAAWQSGGAVQVLGHVEDMPQLLQSVDVVVLPSYREGLPRSLIEAAACGKAIVTTDAPGCREVVTHGLDGLIVPVRNPAALARAIARLHDDPALRQRLGAAARVRALKEFDERIVIARTMVVYQEVLPPGPHGALPVEAAGAQAPGEALTRADL